MKKHLDTVAIFSKFSKTLTMQKWNTSPSCLLYTEKDFENGYHPTDYNKPLGKITVRRAVESSQNIPFVEIMQELKPETSIKYLKKKVKRIKQGQCQL